MSENSKKNLSDYILNSSLNKEEKLLWQLFLKISKPDEDQAVFEAVGEEDGNLEILTKHLADKIFDMDLGKKKVWEILLKDEKKFAKFLNQLC